MLYATRESTSTISLGLGHSRALSHSLSISGSTHLCTCTCEKRTHGLRSRHARSHPESTSSRITKRWWFSSSREPRRITPSKVTTPHSSTLHPSGPPTLTRRGPFSESTTPRAQSASHRYVYPLHKHSCNPQALGPYLSPAYPRAGAGAPSSAAALVASVSANDALTIHVPGATVRPAANHRVADARRRSPSTAKPPGPPFHGQSPVFSSLLHLRPSHLIFSTAPIASAG
jgi:hypothetical protein